MFLVISNKVWTGRFSGAFGVQSPSLADGLFYQGSIWHLGLMKFLCFRPKKKEAKQ